jgi:peptidoglycan/LPS O-acetylase OafA/YrhL
MLLVAFLGRALFNTIVETYGAALFVDAWGEVPSYSASRWLIYISPYGRFFEFLAGIALSEVWMANSRHGIGAIEAKLISFSGLAAIFYIGVSFFDGVFFPPSIFFCESNLMIGYILAVPAALLFCCSLKGKRAAFFAVPVAIEVGNLSYSIYLIHGVLIPFFRTTATEFSAIMVINIILFICTTIIFSYVLYNFLELPAKRAVLLWYKRLKTIYLTEVVPNPRTGV